MKLFNECIRIRNMKWIKSVNNDNSGVGLTFEKQLGKVVESFELPDYDGVEIKAYKHFSTSNLVMFSAAPDSILFAIEKIQKSYGYPDREYRQFRVFNVAVDAISFKSVSRKYFFKLDVNYKRREISLNVYNRKYELIDDEIAWSFDLLEEKLKRKMSKLLIARCKEKIIDGERYYYYTNFDYYLLKSFNAFLKALESGKVIVCFRISVYKKGKYFGKIHNRGSTFDISKKDIEDIFKHEMNI